MYLDLSKVPRPLAGALALFIGLLEHVCFRKSRYQRDRSFDQKL